MDSILELIRPLIESGTLVHRSRSDIERDIHLFAVEGTVACGALYELERGIGEIACLAVHPARRRDGLGDRLLDFLEEWAVSREITKVFVLTKHTAGWFLGQGYIMSSPYHLPTSRLSRYDWNRGSLVLTKDITRLP